MTQFWNQNRFGSDKNRFGSDKNRFYMKTNDDKNKNIKLNSEIVAKFSEIKFRNLASTVTEYDLKQFVNVGYTLWNINIRVCYQYYYIFGICHFLSLFQASIVTFQTIWSGRPDR